MAFLFDAPGRVHEEKRTYPGMAIKIFILPAYFLFVLVIGRFTRTHWTSSPTAYFLADRRLGALAYMIRRGFGRSSAL